MSAFVYSLATKRDGVLYTGMTSDLLRRVFSHKIKAVQGFTARYGVEKLVWYEAHESLESALMRERQIKRWRREWKIALIEKSNPDWEDLFDRLTS